MPVTTRGSRKVIPKSRPNPKSKTRAKAVPKKDGTSADEPSPEAAPLELPIIQTFETTATILQGHCIIRKLEDGRYEIVNFNSADANYFGSIEFGRLIAGDETGGRLKALENAEEQLKGSQLKIGQALSSAHLKIFRFLKLPLELRLIIYDMTISYGRLRIGNYEFHNTLPGIQLRGACRQVYEETSRLFWRNKFHIFDICKQTKLLVPCLTENLREVSWSWWDFKIKDPTTLRMFRGCKNLKIFHLSLTKLCVSPAATYNKPQYLHRQEPAAAKFKHANGFDELVSIRGLNLVTVHNDILGDYKVLPEALSEEEMTAFESFLNQQLTQPRQSVAPKAAKGKATNASKKGPKATNKAKNTSVGKD